MTTNDNNPTPEQPTPQASLGTSSEGTINPHFKPRSWSQDDLSFDVKIPLYHHHNVVVLRCPREIGHPELPYLAKVYSSLENAFTEAFSTQFTNAGAISYLSTHTRMMTQPLLYSPLQTQAKIGSDIIRASYYHDSFDSKTLFIKTPYPWDTCLGAKLRHLVDQTYLTYQNLIIINIWEPSCKELYSSFPGITSIETSLYESIAIGMLHNLDNTTIPEYNVGIKSVLNFIYYLIITAGTERQGYKKGDMTLDQCLVKTHLWSPLGYQERHKVFLDDTQIR